MIFNIAIFINKVKPFSLKEDKKYNSKHASVFIAIIYVDIQQSTR